MIMLKRGLPLVLFIILCSSAYAATYYVTQDSAGSGDGSSYDNRMSVDDHNSGSFSPGDVIYFSGTITSEIRPPSSGSSSGYITYDGWEGGNFDAINLNPATGVAIVDRNRGQHGFDLRTKDYLIIQDFEITDMNIGIITGPAWTGSGSNDPSEYIVIRRNYIHDSENDDTGDRAIFTTTNENYGMRGTRYLTIGGAPGDGNHIFNIGGSFTGDYDIKLAYAEDVVCSYNACHADLSRDLGRSGISWEGNPCGDTHTKNIVIEHNHVYDHAVEGGIGGKCGENIIVRYNVVHGHNGNEGGGLGMWGNWKNHYHYGNLVYDNIMGESLSTGAGTEPGNPCEYLHWNWDGIDGENGYVWGNIFHSNSGAGIFVGGWAGEDYVRNVYVHNNVVADNGFDPEAGWWSGIVVRQRVTNANIKNNILYNNVRGSDYEQLYVQDSLTGETSLDHDIYFVPGRSEDPGTTVNWGGNNQPVSAIENNGAYMDPSFKGPGSNEYTLSEGSDCIDNGADLTGLVGSVTITDGHGDTHTYNMRWEDVLDPATDLSSFPLDIQIADQNSFGTGWEPGAYVYTGGTTQTCINQGHSCCNSCQSGIEDYPSLSGTCSLGELCCDDCSTTPTCTQGQITSTCLCGGVEYTSGYCCGDSWQSTPCTAQPHSYAIKKTRAPPTIDGDISEFNADEIVITDSVSGTVGRYRLMWDDTALYIAAEFSDAKLNAEHTQEDAYLWEDDSLEIMFDSEHDKGSTIQDDDYKFYINLHEIHADSQAYDLTWDSEISYALAVSGTVNSNSDTDTGYTVEAKIPWWVTPPVFGSDWGMNIALNDQISAGTYPTQTQWSDSGLDFNSPDGWEDVIFVHSADTSKDGCIDMNELTVFIDLWKQNSVNIGELMEAIGLWKGGCQ